MKTLVFLPDTNKNSGFGHFYRCFKYSQFLDSKFKIFFLINNSFNKKILKNKKINFIFYKDYASFKRILYGFKESIIFLDSYSILRHKLINDYDYFYKTISILDYKIESGSDILIDHTFLRKKSYYKKLANYQQFFAGHNYFPIKKKIKNSKKDIILIDIGSVKNCSLIDRCLKIFQKLFTENSTQIIIINKYYSKNNLNNFSFKKKIKLFKHHPNIKDIYSRTIFSIGGCGISLYEKCFFGIPTFAKSFAKNQDNNFENFFKKKCILRINDIFQINNKKKIYSLINKIKINLSKNFIILKNKDKIYNMFDEI